MSPIRVAFDGDIFLRERFGGISRVMTELGVALRARNDVRVSWPFLFSANAYLRDAGVRHVDVSGWPNFRGRNTVLALANRATTAAAALTGRVDVLHATFYDAGLIAQRRRGRLVVTVHDMIPEKFPAWWGDSGSPHRGKRELVEAADAVCVVSRNTAADLVACFGTDPGKLHHVSPAVSDAMIFRGAPRMALPARYLLFVGRRNGYKNFNRFFAAAAPLMKARADLHLICAGARPFDGGEVRMIDAAGLAGRVRHLGASDAELAELYGRATLFVFPSLYEGFGVPLLEAFANGCAAAASDRGSLPEVGAGACAHFDPDSEEAMGIAMAAILDDDGRRRDLAARGLKRAGDFSWPDSAAALASVYRRVTA
ncbi:MAG: glycosyltransferase family 4 protein [Alphaproteobacteria bacterium]|nr:glycosyltransferase family 4 protein [Alphaproteobacteria bacterium]